VTINSDETHILHEYIKSLTIFEADLELMLQGFEIRYSIDFFDLIEYSFPFLNKHLNINLIEDEKSKYVIKQLGRHIIFSNFGNFCSKPILLLPPHLNELIGFMEVINSSIETYQNLITKREYLANIIQKLEKIKGDKNMNPIDNDLLYKMINSEGKNIAFVLTPSFESDINFFKNLIHEVDIYGKDIKDYISIYSQTKLMSNSILRDRIEAFRPHPSKLLANSRDAEAIQFVLNLNNSLKLDKKIIFYISSAPHMERLQRVDPLFYRINGKDYTLIRNSTYFFVSMLEYMSFIEKERPNSLDYQELLIYIRDEIKLLTCAKERIREVITNSDGVQCGPSNNAIEFPKIKEAEARLAYYSALEADELLEEYLTKRERIDIAFLIKNKLPSPERDYLRKLSVDVTASIDTIINAIKSERFLNYLNGKKMELEFEKIKYILKLLDLTKNIKIKNINEIIEIIHKYQDKEIFALSHDFKIFLEEREIKPLIEKLNTLGLPIIDNASIIGTGNNFALIDEETNKLIYTFEIIENKILVYRFDYELTKSFLKIVIGLSQENLSILSRDLKILLDFLENKINPFLNLNFSHNKELVDLANEALRKMG